MVSKEFILGFIAGEGTFTVGRKRTNGRYYLAPYFQFRVSGVDENIVRDMWNTFDNIGTVNVAEYDQDYGPMVQWRIESKGGCKELARIIYESAPDEWWMTEKGKNFDVWSDIVDIYYDGQTTPEDRITMSELARDGLNVSARNSKSEEDWNEMISIFEEQRNTDTPLCGSMDTVSGDPCEQRVSEKGLRCKQHRE